MKETHKRETVRDKECRPYTVLFSKRNIQKKSTLVGTIYAGNSYVAEAYGKNKSEVMKHIRENLNIIIYD